MTKAEWEKLYGILDGIYSDFYRDYYEMRNGRNKKIKNEAERKVVNSIDLACLWINKFPSSFDLMMGENASDFNRSIIWEEFIKPNWFSKDMPDFLKK